MKKTRIYQTAGAVLFAALFTFFSPNAQSQIAEDSKTYRMVENLNDQFESALNTGDFYNVSALYADNAKIITSSGETISGRKAISEYFNSNRGNKNLELEVLEVGGSGKTLYQVGRAIATSESGEKSSSDFLIVWERQPDWEYKIYLDTL
ncbi:MAG: nuclear transport factor 2 family protein [Bacteroidia bacterium]|nr:nuclear transport factor 2 family protein [Bacteroidia bacterium]